MNDEVKISDAAAALVLEKELDVTLITGTGADGNITKADVDKYIKSLAPDDKGEYILVSTANRQNRRRAGITFGPEPIKVYEGDIDEDGFKAIDADPMLKISHD